MYLEGLDHTCCSPVSQAPTETQKVMCSFKRVWTDMQATHISKHMIRENRRRQCAKSKAICNDLVALTSTKQEASDRGRKTPFGPRDDTSSEIKAQMKKHELDTSVHTHMNLPQTLLLACKQTLDIS